MFWFEKWSIQNDHCREIWNFHELLKVKEDIARRERTNIKIENRKKNKIRELLDIGKNVLVLDERVKKKRLLDFYTKAQLKINHFSIKIKNLLQEKEY